MNKCIPERKKVTDSKQITQYYFLCFEVCEAFCIYISKYCSLTFPFNKIKMMDLNTYITGYLVTCNLKKNASMITSKHVHIALKRTAVACGFIYTALLYVLLNSVLCFKRLFCLQYNYIVSVTKLNKISYFYHCNRQVTRYEFNTQKDDFI